MNLRDFQRSLRNIRSLERGIHPDSAWVSRTRETLLAEVVKTMPAKPSGFRARLGATIRYGWQSRLAQWFRGPALAFLSLAGVVLGGSLASVSAAERSIPGDLLYPIKLAAEQTQLALTSDKSEKLKLKTEFVQRRVAEIQSIVSSDVSQKPARIQEATDILTRDLDTVKSQLNDVSQDGSVQQTAQAAKLLDQKSTEIASGLKTVTPDVPAEVKGNLAQAEAAAVNTGVKAVQVLIQSKDQPAAQQVMSSAELLRSIDNKVQGIQQNITDAAQNLLGSATGTGAVASSTAMYATSTVIIPAAATSSSISQIQTAQNTLDQAKQLLSQNKLSEVTDKLLEASSAVVNAETGTETAATSSAALPPPDAATSTAPTASTSTAPTSSSSTPPTSPTSSSTTSTATTTHT